MESPKYRAARRALAADPYVTDPAALLRELHTRLPLREVCEAFARVTGVTISHETARRWMNREAA